MVIKFILFLLKIQSKFYNRLKMIETIDRAKLLEILKNDIYCEGYGLYALVKIFEQNRKRERYFVEDGMIWIEKAVE